MTVTLNLPPATAQKLSDLAAQAGQSLEGYLQQLAEQHARLGNGTAQAAQLSPQEWSAKWRAWAASHPTLPTLADDSRASIYAGRGE